MTEPTTAGIVFPKVDTGSQVLAAELPPEPKGAMAEGLGQLAVSPAATRQGLVCKDLLQGPLKAQAEQEAAKTFVDLQKNPQAILVYGISAMDGVNRLIDRMLRDEGRGDVAEVRQLMRELSNSMRGVKGKYDLANPKVRSEYQDWISGKKSGMFRRVRDFVSDFRTDLTDIEAQFDRVLKTLKGQQGELIKSISFYDDLYRENEQEIANLIRVIAVMEMMAERARNEAAAIVIGDASLGDRGQERRDMLADLSTSLELKIAEYKGRLFVAWATSPQVRLSRQLALGMGLRLNETEHVTIPTMKATIAQWLRMAKTLSAADFANEMRDALNGTLQGFYEGAAQATPVIANAINTPSLSVETIGIMADSISSQADAISQALEEGMQKRQEVEQAMLEAKQVLNAAGEKINTTAVEHVLARANSAQQTLYVKSTVVR